MSTDATAAFVGIRIQGGLLPADLLAKLATGTDLPGLTSADFHLPAGESVREAANRVWAYLRGAWTTYRQALAALPDSDTATSLTRERFLLVMLDQLGYGRVPTTGKGGITVGTHGHPVSNLWGSVPIHLLGRVPLDTRSKGVAGAAGASPQSMVQELLNRSDTHLWAILANATTLRLLRDSTSLVGSAYVEFDLEAIFDGDLFADFLLLYTLCHVSRVEARDTEIGPASCWLEQWRQDAVDTGSRALNLLRDGVVDALQTLGAGFLAHPDNGALRDDLAEGRLSVADVHHALLRVAYRMLFTFVAEDRGALLDPNATPQARQRYTDYFSTDRLRRTARRRRGGRHGDKWQALSLVWRGLGSVDGLPELGLPGIGGLFESGELDFLGDCALSNQALQSAVRSLSVVREPRSNVLRVVDYRNLGAEELGSIYEALLEFVPAWDSATKTYTLSIASGNQRKDTGSYYTPTSLVESLLDTALDPVLDDAEKSSSDDAIEALLNVTVCDPACGSGHFLVGAARRIAKRVAALRTGDPEPTPEAVRSAMREVAGRCVYGVDVNPLAAELAKVSLWMEALEPGRPLTFLDAQIKVGNALVGTTPNLLAEGLPDDAFKPIEGDDKRVTSTLAKQNKAERSAQGSLFDVDMVAANTTLVEQVQDMVAARTLSLADVHVQQQRLRAYTESDDYRTQRLAADAWCAAFVWPKTPAAPKAITHRTITRLAEGEDRLDERSHTEIERLAAEYRFFHWHLEFPHIFPTTPAAGDTVNPATGWAGGFSVVIGNPPWERVKLQEQEFFAARDPEIAMAPNAAARKRLIAKLPDTNEPLHLAFVAEKRRAEGISHLMRTSGRYPLTGRGDINTYAVFAETDRNLLGGSGRLGVILPTGIATDATTQYFFKDLVESGAISSLYDFENAKPLFEGVHRSFKFCLLTLVGRDSREPEANFSFFAHDPTDLQRAGVTFALTPEEITLLNPNTGTCPVFRSRRDAEIAASCAVRHPVIWSENAKSFKQRTTRFSELSDLGKAEERGIASRHQSEGRGWSPVYEAKLFHQYDHRFATYVGTGLATVDRAIPTNKVVPRLWLRSDIVEQHYGNGWNGWVVAYRDIARSTDERTMIASVLPSAAADYTVRHLVGNWKQQPYLLAMFNTFAFDYLVRLRNNGTHLSDYLVYQVPVPSMDGWKASLRWTNETMESWFSTRLVQLVYTAADLEKFGEFCGFTGEPFVWRAENRERLLMELDSAAFHLYGISRDDVDHIMETFPIVKRKDIAAHGEYRTKRMILEIYDAMAEAEATGTPYETQFDDLTAQ